MTDNLISITDILSAASSRGISIGRGDPREHLSYLSKIGLLPPAKKKRNSLGFIEGHYPASVVDRLEALAKMKKQGMTFSQMKFTLSQVASHKISKPESFHSSEPTFQTFEHSNFQTSYLPILIIGILIGYLVAITRGSAVPSVLSSNQNVDTNIGKTYQMASVSQPTIDTAQESNYVIFGQNGQRENLDPEKSQIFVAKNQNSEQENLQDNGSQIFISIPKSHFGNLDKNINIKF